MSDGGHRLGGCRMERVQSRSEHSLLYRAYSEELARPVMIKVLDPRFPPNSSTAKRFLRGGEIARSLEHPHIVQTFAAGQENNAAYMILEFLEGHSLDRVLHVHRKIKYAAALDIVRQIAQALEYAIGKNVVHRKIEPSHIMLSPGGRASILGFGLARLAEAQDNAITAEGALVGISSYSCPEVGLGVQDIRGDLYSLGAVLYHMLGGRPPYQGRDALELLHRHRTEPLWPVRDLAGPDLPEEVEALVHGLMAKDVNHRIQTPGELIACVDAIVNPDIVGEHHRSDAGQTLVMTTREMMALRQRSTVLACDDQPYNISLLHEVLRRLGFKTLTTRDGRAALGALGEKEVDLLLTDAKLPGLGGRPFLEAVTKRRPKLPIILTRGGKGAGELKRAFPYNVVDCIERPLDPHAVRDLAMKALR